MNAEYDNLIHLLTAALEQAKKFRPEAGSTRDAKDAERYRFLKARRGNIVEISWNSFHGDIYSMAKMGNVDAAIDKAIALTTPQDGEPK